MYTFYTTQNKVICVSSYAGKSVRGVAKCAPADTFDLAFGKKLAQARCDEKIARRRVANAEQRMVEAVRAANIANARVAKMEAYLTDALDAAEDALCFLDSIEHQEV